MTAAEKKKMGKYITNLSANNPSKQTKKLFKLWSNPGYRAIMRKKGPYSAVYDPTDNDGAFGSKCASLQANGVRTTKKKAQRMREALDKYKLAVESIAKSLSDTKLFERTADGYGSQAEKPKGKDGEVDVEQMEGELLDEME
eukprot:CAMPEP_0197539018 /NCGR_PEP_ID=MMETSP1318-20131121/61422_1 /TAXON_ID=552666 /ORGANISM="Partenskyella glossopodia, Strain RCC365" /LENGTH=141 /DNA_ID=CAMNT_0043097613 /DNA_START=105 /DNA_END=530 /DNA_ORIENTATION=+